MSGRWVVLVGCSLATLCLGGTQWSFGVFFTSIETEFAWSRAAVSSLYTALIVGYSVSAIVAGRLSDRHSPRPVLLVSAGLLGAALILTSRGQAINELRAGFLGAGLGGGAALSVPLSVVQRWFSHGRLVGLALATVMAGVGIGAMAFAPLLSYLVETEGWRYSIRFAGLLLGGLTGLAGLLIPAGSPGPVHGGGDISGVAEGSACGRASFGRLLVSRPFIALAYSTIVALFTFQVISVHFVPYAVDRDITKVAAAMALGTIGGASVPGRFLAGGLHARFGWHATLMIALALSGGALILLVGATNLQGLYAFVAVYGLAHGMRAVALVGTIRQQFGTCSLGQLIGTTVAFAQLSAAAAPYIAGAVFDRTGSYAFLLVPLCVLLLLAAGLVKVWSR